MQKCTNHSRYQWIDLPAAMLAGFLVFLLIYGSDILSIYNYGWMLVPGDYQANFLGWDLWRTASWRVPLWIASIFFPNGWGPFYTDSIPLLAAIGKLVAFVVPGHWQYFGPWLAICFILQGYWAYRLAELMTPSRLLRLFVVAVFILAPPLAFRRWHISLCSHWLLLVCLWIYFSSGDWSWRRVMIWSAMLTLLASGLSPYLVLMVLALLFAVGLRRFSESSRWYWFSIPALSVGVGLAGWYLAGGFMIKPLPMKDGWGSYAMNLNSLFNPMDYSNFLPSLPLLSGQYEGFNYLGAGGILLIGVAAFLMILRGRLLVAVYWRRLWPLLMVLMILTGLALSCAVTFNRWVLFDLRPFPEPLTQLFSQFRSSGRLFWPVYYALLAGGLWVLLQNKRRQLIVVILSIIILLQICDLNYISGRSMVIHEPIHQTRLADPAWHKLYDAYPHIAWVGNRDDSLIYFQDCPDFIMMMKPGFNTINQFPQSRYDLNILRTHVEMMSRLRTGQIAADTLYCLGGRTTPDIAVGLRQGGAGFYHLNDYWVAVRPTVVTSSLRSGELHTLADFLQIHRGRPLLLMLPSGLLGRLPPESRESLLAAFPELRGQNGDMPILAIVDASPRRVGLAVIDRPGTFALTWQGRSLTVKVDKDGLMIADAGGKVNWPVGRLAVAALQSDGKLATECYDQWWPDWKLVEK